MYTLMTMDDPRWMELAALFCKSTKLKKGDDVLLHAIDLESLPLLFALYKQAVLGGAGSVNFQMTIPALEHFFLKHAQEFQLKKFPKWEMDRMKKMDIFMAARARTNGFSLVDVPTQKTSLRNKVIDPITDERVKNTRWCITYVPTDHDALLAGMSTPEYFDFYFKASLQDYEAMKSRNLLLKGLMEKTDKVSIIAQGTHLEFSIAGIPVNSCHGESNIPDGEVYTAPIKHTVSGVFHSNAPSFYQGREWTNVHLEFSKGKIIEASCDQGKELLNDLLDVDEGARYIGEFAIGTNIGIRKPAKNILFDEKIFGSFHFTPGDSYSEADNGNHSCIHWDLVKIMTPEFGGGVIKFDGVEIMRDGVFVHPEILELNP